MTCKLCEKDKPLVEAHIIPRCINKELISSGGALKRISKYDDMYPARFPTGEYDKNILCSECDNSFSPWDDYAHELLFSEFETKYPIRFTTDASPHLPGLFKIPKFDYQKLKLFFLSVLWRASVSQRASFNRIDLGPYEKPIRKMLKEKNAGDWQTFPVVLFRYIDYSGQQVMLGAHRNRDTMGLTVNNVFLPGFQAAIKVDRRPFPASHKAGVMAPDQPLFIAAKNMEHSSEYEAFKKIILNNYKG